MTNDLANPFSTSRVRPGQVAFQFLGGANAPQLASRLCDCGWWGQIVGSHGVGKSTLLHALMPAFVAAGRTISWWTLQGGQRWWPAEMAEATRAWNATTLVIVDGYEQLNRLARWRLKARCRSARAGLLITSHYDVGLPPLLALTCPIDTVQHLVARLCGTDPIGISPAEVSSCYAMHQGNVREVFFALYDLYEQRRRGLQTLPGLPA